MAARNAPLCRSRSGRTVRTGGIGRPARVVEAAIARLDEEFGLFDASPIILNPAQGGAGRDFANAVALVESDLRAARKCSRSSSASNASSAAARGRRWGPRVLDLDIVLWSGGKFRSRRLTIPHPQLGRRSFVLQPLAAIAPGWRVGGLTVAASRPPPCPPAATRLTAAAGGPIAQLVEQLTFNQ